MIDIYTDGSCRGNPGPGGWAALIVDGDDESIIRGGEKETTNNRMELTSIIKALEEITPNSDNPPKVTIFSDSTYCVKGINEWLPGWIKSNFKGKKNIDIWREYLKVSNGIDVTLKWVKAHNGHPQNEMVDSIAFSEATNFLDTPK